MVLSNKFSVGLLSITAQDSIDSDELATNEYVIAGHMHPASFPSCRVLEASVQSGSASSRYRDTMQEFITSKKS